MENQYQHRRNLSQDSEKDNSNPRTKPTRVIQGTPGEKENYNKGGSKHNNNNFGDFPTDSNTESQGDIQDSDLRRKGELNHAIFVKLQEISRYNIEIGNYEEGLANYDKCIEHLIRTLPEGHTSAIFVDFLQKTVKSLNEIALKLLQDGKVKESLLLLERCRKMTHPNSFGPYPTLRSLTYNHLGCCYRRIGKLDKALYYLEKAWEFIQGIEKVETTGITHINLCAVLSQLGDHKRALEHAKMAVSDCAYDLIESTKKHATEDASIDVNKKATMLAISYHNLATEEEACGNAEAALQAYLRAANLIREHNHPQHELCVKFGKAYEEAKLRLNKPGFRRTVSPGTQMRRYGTSPPTKVTVKRPPSYNTAGKAAKAYLQHNKVVIPRRKVNPSRPMTSHGLSPNAGHIQNQKLFLPGARITKGSDRPLTAHPQSRTQHYQIRGVDETPKNGHPDSEREREEIRASHSEAESEIERLGLNDEDLEKADLKQNRLAFLQSLNQYNNQVHHPSEKNNPTLKNNYIAEEKHQPASKQGTEASKRSEAREHKQKELDPIKLKHAVLKLQSFCRGHQARQEVARLINESPQTVQPIFLVVISETMKGNLENGPVMKETLYYFLMMYELHSQLIHIYIKNLENKKFHKALVEYQIVNRTSKEAIEDELREACEKLIQHLEIHQDQVVFRDDEEEAHAEELYMMGQEMARREQENAITEITERTDERTDESEGKPANSRQEEEMYSDRGIKKHNEGNTYEEQVPKEDVFDEIGEEDNKYDEELTVSHDTNKHAKKEKFEEKIKEEDVYEEEIYDEEKQASPEKNKKQENPMKDKKEEDAYEEVFEEEIKDEKEDKKENEKPAYEEFGEPEEKEEEEDNQPKVDSKDVAGLVGLRLFGNRPKKEVEDAVIFIQKHVKGKLARDQYKLFKKRKFKVVFSRCLNISGDIIGIRLVDNVNPKEHHSTYDLCLHNFTKSKQFKTLDFPKNLVDLPNLTLEELTSLLIIDVPNANVEIKPDVKIKKQQKEIPEQENNEEFLAAVPLFFGKDKLDSTIHYDKKGDKILVKHGEGNHPRTLEVEIQDLDMDGKFNKQEFINNMDIILLSKLNYNNGGLIYERSPVAESIFHKPENYTEEQKRKTEVEEDPLPDLNDPDVQRATSTIQNAYKKKKKDKNKEKEQEEKRSVSPNKRYSEKALDEIDTHNLRENRGGKVDSTKSGFLFVNQEADELHHARNDQISTKNVNSSNQMASFRGDELYEDSNRQRQEFDWAKNERIESTDTLTRLASPKQNVLETDELPNLEDPEVQKATSKIQNAYKKKQDKNKEKNRKEELEREKERERELEKQREQEEQFAKQTKDEEDEMPDLNDKEVQDATLKIQKAYMRKKKGAEKENTPTKQKYSQEFEDNNQKRIKKNETPIRQRNAHDLEDDYESATKKKIAPLMHTNSRELEDDYESRNIKIKAKNHDDDELPNLEDKGVQDATFKIQKAYKKKQDKNKEKNRKEELEREKERERERELEKQREQEEQFAKQTKDEEDEMPDLNDKGVQDATLKIQKAYMRKKKGAEKKSTPVQQRNSKDLEDDYKSAPKKERSPIKHRNSNELEDDYAVDFKDTESPKKEEKAQVHLNAEHQHHSKPEKLEESGLVLKEVNDELDVFEGDKIEDDDDKPYDDKASEQQKEKKPKKADLDEEDFEPFEEEF